jgi:ribosomal protein S18 acetylase RimI-like enzyme
MGVSARLHGSWRPHQEAAVRGVLADRATHAWVAEGEQGPVGFVAATLNTDRLIGEITMLAVDPGDQNRGLGRALTEFATGWLREAGMRVAMVDTGGDPGHAPHGAFTSRPATRCSPLPGTSRPL